MVSLVNVLGYYLFVQKALENARNGVFINWLFVLLFLLAEAAMFYIYNGRGHLTSYITPKLQNKAKLFVSFYQVVCLFSLCFVFWLMVQFMCWFGA